MTEYSKWQGMWKDDKGRFVLIDAYETPEGLAKGFFIPFSDDNGEKQMYRDGNHTFDGSKLMEKKRGEEIGWPL